MGKLLLLTLNEQEEKAIDKILATISDCVSLEAVQTIPIPASKMSFPGLEIRKNQHCEPFPQKRTEKQMKKRNKNKIKKSKVD